jgi:hypothetical protein
MIWLIKTVAIGLTLGVFLRPLYPFVLVLIAGYLAYITRNRFTRNKNKGVKS